VSTSKAVVQVFPEGDAKLSASLLEAGEGVPASPARLAAGATTDLSALHVFPLVDVGSGGSVLGLIAALDKVTAELPADVRVIPGHGKVASLEDVEQLSATLKDCVKLVEAQVKQKKSLAEVQQARPLAKYDELGKGMIKTEFFVETLFNELMQRPRSKFMSH
jgi:hypothetical protein